MATAFTEYEKERIKEKLTAAAMECMSKYGIKKTTVDQLVQMAGISKGAFYSFFPSKELLFFQVFEEYQSNITQELFTELEKTGQIGKQAFAELIFKLFQSVRHSFILNIITNQELEYLMRKLPVEVMQQHHSFDEQLAQRLVACLNMKEGIEIEVVAAALRALFMTLLHEKEIGSRDFDGALKLLIAGFAEQIIEEA